MNILLYSSGLDSYIAYYYLKIEKEMDVLPVYVNLGHKYNEVEQRYIRKYRPETIIIQLEQYGKLFEEYNAYIPNRNLLLCLVVCSYFESHTNQLNIYLGGLKDDRIYDNNKKTFRVFERAFNVNPDIEVKINSAFDFKMTKKDIIDWYVDNVLDETFNLHSRTFSCYNPIEDKKDPHCYSCKACYRKAVALFDYQKIPIENMELVRRYAHDIRENPDMYDDTRVNQINKYTKWMLGLS